MSCQYGIQGDYVCHPDEKFKRIELDMKNTNFNSQNMTCDSKNSSKEPTPSGHFKVFPAPISYKPTPVSSPANAPTKAPANAFVSTPAFLT